MKKWRVISLLLGAVLLGGVVGWVAAELVRPQSVLGDAEHKWNVPLAPEVHGPPLEVAREIDKSILPLREVRRRVAHRIRGRVIEIEFEFEHGRPVYEFKYIMPNGRVRELYVDARTGRVIKEEDDD